LVAAVCVRSCRRHFILAFSRKRAYESGDYAAALKELVPVADRGDAEALYLVGSMIFDGLGTTKDKLAGAALFQVATDAGNAEAELRLSVMYQHGNGVWKDTDKPLYWLRRAKVFSDRGQPKKKGCRGGLLCGAVVEGSGNQRAVARPGLRRFVTLRAARVPICERKNCLSKMLSGPTVTPLDL
jgi:hypothetical protein